MRSPTGAILLVVFDPLGKVGLALLLALSTACSGVGTSNTTPVTVGTSVSQPPTPSVERDADVPPLPFPDNPDPNACGLPAPMGDYAGWVNGIYQGQMVEPSVLLYDSHERKHITGTVLSGTQVHVQLHQSNPVLDFYYVEADTPGGQQKGWVPAPFLEFNPPSS